MLQPFLFPLGVLASAGLSLAGCAGPGSSTGDFGAGTRTTQSTVSQADSPKVTILGHDPDGCTWVESTASIAFGEHDTKHQARAQAVSEARIKAMQHLLGVRVQHTFIDFQQENSLKGNAALTEHLLRVTQLGRVLKEDILWAGPVDLTGCHACRFEARIRACIVPLRDLNDRDFAVHLFLNQGRFHDGEEALIAVTPTRDAYVYVFNVDMEWNATLVFPNDYAKSNFVGAGQTFMYPNEPLRARGIRTVARLPPGASISAEMMRVIASKVPLPRALLEPSDLPGSFLSLMRKLNATELEWVEDAQAFTIQKR